MLLGLISDTHGYLGADTLRALEGCQQILHAGDIGDGVLEPLRAIAPVLAVRGNNDLAGEPAELPFVAWYVCGGVQIAVVHQLPHAPAEGWDVLVYGHSHRAALERRDDGKLLVNPGAAGIRGFHTSRSVALLEVAGGAIGVRFAGLGARAAVKRERRTA